MPLDLPPVDALDLLRASVAAPAIIRPAEHSILRPGYFRPVSRGERREIVADLVRTGRLTREEARKAMFLAPVVGWAAEEGESGGNDEYTKLLLHFEGDLTDSSSEGATVSAVSAAAVSTSQKVFGSYGLSLPTTGDRISCPVPTIFTTAWTIDFWMYHTGGQYPVGGSSRSLLMTTQSSTLYWYLSSNGSSWNVANFQAGSATISTSTWYHIEVGWDGSTYRAFVDGTLDISLSSSTALNSQTTLEFGQNSAFGGDWRGYQDEIRVSIGIARHTSDFTPPSAPYY